MLSKKPVFELILSRPPVNLVERPVAFSTPKLHGAFSFNNFIPMTLEDSVGDIIRKARQSASVSAEAAAQAAGLSTSEFAGLEETGQSVKLPNYDAVAKL